MKIVEIFQSIDGEVNCFGQGGLTTFIRTAGCNLNCSFCDTPQRLLLGEDKTVEQIVETVIQLQCPKATITGGEPLLQYDEVLLLIDKLLDLDFKITVETNGTLMPPYLYTRKENLGWVFDYKLEFEEKMRFAGMVDLPAHNYIKFIIQNKDDYDKAKKVAMEFYNNGCQAKMVFSPCMPDGMESCFLISHLIKDRLWFVGFNLQIHKIINVK